MKRTKRLAAAACWAVVVGSPNAEARHYRPPSAVPMAAAAPLVVAPLVVPAMAAPPAAAASRVSTTLPIATGLPVLRPARRGPKLVPHGDQAAKPPPAEVTLFLDAPTQRGPWTLRMTNDGNVPVRVAADARLLALDVTPRSARKPQHCELPADMRPDDALERSLVLAPKRAYVETFEPRLYCFAGKDLDALASGAVVVAHLGSPSAADGGFTVVTPMDGVKPEVDGRKFLESPPIRLSDEPVAAALPSAEGDPEAPKLLLTAPDTVDAASSDTIAIPVTLKNGGLSPLIVRFRPEMLRFDVVRPSGTDHCVWPVVTAAATRELFTTLPAKSGSAEVVADLGDYCVQSTLDRAGLLAVWPRLDMRSGSGESIGIRSFDGQVIGRSPTFVRLHRGRAPEPLGRPRVESR
jgi:hypothetical protein